MSAWYILSPLKALCLKCPVPGGCDEGDKRCLRRRAKTAHNARQRGFSVRGAQILRYLESHPGEWYRIKEIGRAVGLPYPTASQSVRRLCQQDRIERVGARHTLQVRAKEAT